MKEGASRAQVQAQLDLIAERLTEEYPGYWQDLNGEPQALRLQGVVEARVPGGAGDGEVTVAIVVGILSTIVLLVLGIACSNVANLLLTRAQHRRSEIAVRIALGAGRRRLVTQLLSESVLLAGAAAVCSFLLVHWLTDLLAAGRLTFGLDSAVDITTDWRVVAFTGLMAVGTGVMFGLVPALQASRPDLLPALKGLEEPGRRRFLGVRNLLVMAQVAGSVILLVGATLLLRSLHEAARADIGFDPENVAVVPVDLGQRQYTPKAAAQFYFDVMQRIESFPGVEGVVLAETVPLAGGRNRWGGLSVDGYEAAPNEFMVVDGNVVTPGYFDLIGMRLVAGRDFTARDRDGAPEVVVINEAFVDRYFAGRNPLGRSVASWDVVGVVADAKYNRLGEPLTPHVWLPYLQHPSLAQQIHVRTTGDVTGVLPALVREVQQFDPSLPILQPTTLTRLTASALLPQKVMSLVLGVAGALTLGMAMMGIYGVMAYAVSQRTHEVGLRVALGAHPSSVVRMILREGLALAGAALIVGLSVAALLTQALRAFLYGVSPVDPLAMLAGPGVLLLAAATASLFPALRAARVDPMESLRAE